MSLSSQDWTKLRYPILGLGAALVLVGLLVSFANQYQQKSLKAVVLQQNLLNQARQKFQSSGFEKETIQQYLPRYNQLISNGFIGEERRIEWIENLRQIHDAHRLFSIDYSIGLQENFKPSYLPNLGNFKLQRSTMKLNLELLHENDLLNLLDGLRGQPTPYIVRDCEITRPSGAVINNKEVAANLRAVCEIDWLTIRDPQLSNAISNAL